MTPFDQLAAVTTLNSTNSGFMFRYSPPQEFGVNAFGEGVRYIYDPVTRDISVDDESGSLVFMAGDIDPTAPAGTTRYVRADGLQLVLIQPAPGGAGLRWTRFIEHTNLLFGDPIGIIAVTGLPTPVADIPTSGTANFTRTMVIGDAYVRDAVTGAITAYSLAPNTLTASVNFATQRIDFTLTLIGRPASGADISLVSVNGSSDFSGVSPSVTFASPLTSVHSDFIIGSALFGTAAAEAGGVFVYRGASSDGRTSLNLVGRFAGTR